MIDARKYLQAVIDEIDAGGEVDIVVMVIGSDDDGQTEVEVMSTLDTEGTATMARDMVGMIRPLHS